MRPRPVAKGLVVATLVGAMASPGGAREVEVSADRPFPTWREPLVLVLRGESETPCGAAAVRLGRTSVSLAERRIDLELREPCGQGSSPASGEPFEVRAELGRIPDGEWTVRVFDDVDGEVELRTLDVFDAGQLDLDLPELVLAGAPVPLRVRGFAACAAAHASAHATVSPGLIEVTAHAPCFPITNPPGGYYARDLELPALAAGDYVLRAVGSQPYSGLTVQESTLRVWDPELCVPSATRLCLQRGRFRVTATWRDFDGNEGAAGSAPLVGNDTTGLLWFFSPGNAELTVKVLDGCGLNERWWVFLSSASNVRYEVVVTDMRTGAEKRYENALGNLPRLSADTAALEGCGPGG